jgi:hypothetical protein
MATDYDWSQHQRVEIERDGWGRPILPDPISRNRRAWTRVTTLANTISDRYALEQWSQRQLVKGFVANEDLLLRAAAAGDDRDELTRVVEAALDAARSSSAADKGTAVHRLTERLDAGEDVTVPRDYAADVEAYTAALREHQIKVLPGWIERFVLNRDLESGGTPDRLVSSPLSDLPMIFDLKTGANAVRYSSVEIAAQLTIYAWASHWWDGRWHEMPEIDRDIGIVLHLPVGTGQATVYKVDLVKGRQIVRVSSEVRDARKLDNVMVPMEAGSAVANDEMVRRRVANIKRHIGDRRLPVVWPDGLGTPSKRSTPYDDLEASLVLRWCQQTEDALQIPPFSSEVSGR